MSLLKISRVKHMAFILPVVFLLSACAGTPGTWNTATSSQKPSCCAKMAGKEACPMVKSSDEKKSCCCSGGVKDGASKGMMCKP